MSNEKCPSCGENPAGETGMISFEFQGVKVEFREFGSQCADCARKEFEEKFEKYGKNVIIIENGHVNLDWEHILSFGKNSERRQYIMFLLIDLGILSHNAMLNWEVVACNMNINPMGGGELFFTRREDAEKFARSDLGAALYPWEIRHIDQVVKEII